MSDKVVIAAQAAEAAAANVETAVEEAEDAIVRALIKAIEIAHSAELIETLGQTRLLASIATAEAGRATEAAADKRTIGKRQKRSNK